MKAKTPKAKTLKQRMRKLTRHLKRILKSKPGLWVILSSGAMVFFIIHNSFDSFVALHNGASIEQVSSRRYSPVFSEALWLIVIATFGSMIGAIMLKWGKWGAVGLAIVSYISIGAFAYWAYDYTHQNVTEGVMTLLITMLSTAVIVAVIMISEACVRKRRRRRQKTTTQTRQ